MQSESEMEIDIGMGNEVRLFHRHHHMQIARRCLSERLTVTSMRARPGDGWLRVEGGKGAEQRPHGGVAGFRGFAIVLFGFGALLKPSLMLPRQKQGV